MQANRAQFFARDAMSNEYWPHNMEGSTHCEDVIGQPISRVIRQIRRRSTGGSKPAPGYSIDVIGRSQLRRKLVEDMCGVSKTSQENQRLARSSPIQHLQLHVLVNSYEMCRMLGRV